MFYFVEEFILYFEHLNKLSFEERPDYDYLKRLFSDLFKKRGFQFDHVYDWDKLEEDAAATSSVAPVANVRVVAQGKQTDSEDSAVECANPKVNAPSELSGMCDDIEQEDVPEEGSAARSNPQSLRGSAPKSAPLRR